MHVACNYGHTKMLKLLYDHLLTVKSVEEVHRTPHSTHDDGTSLFHKACQNGNIEMVKYLMTIMTIDIDHIDKYGQTPLFHACIHGKPEIVECLLSQNADVNKTDNRGNTPLLSALNASEPNREIIELLLDTNKVQLNLDYINWAGDNLLFNAARCGSLKLAGLLLTENVCIYNQSE